MGSKPHAASGISLLVNGIDFRRKAKFYSSLEAKNEWGGAVSTRDTCTDSPRGNSRSSVELVGIGPLKRGALSPPQL